MSSEVVDNMTFHICLCSVIMRFNLMSSHYDTALPIKVINALLPNLLLFNKFP